MQLSHAWRYVFAPHTPIVNMAGDPALIADADDRREAEGRGALGQKLYRELTEALTESPEAFIEAGERRAWQDLRRYASSLRLGRAQGSLAKVWPVPPRRLLLQIPVFQKIHVFWL